jgi:hypothetical protein
MEAEAAHREALTVRTRDRVPFDWAATQTNLGAALALLGERQPGTEHLKEAVAASREALTVYSREHLPLSWAVAQSNLGATLVTLGKRETGTRLLEVSRPRTPRLGADPEQPWRRSRLAR